MFRLHFDKDVHQIEDVLHHDQELLVFVVQKISATLYVLRHLRSDNSVPKNQN